MASFLFIVAAILLTAAVDYLPDGWIRLPLKRLKHRAAHAVRTRTNR